MKQHYGISDAEWPKLSELVTTRELFNSIHLFDPNESGAPISKVSLMYYIDKFGDIEGNKKSDIIARAVFNSLSNKDKIEVMQYLQNDEEE